MQEKFDLNKKIEQKEYRKTLADELREVIQKSGFEEARDELDYEKRELPRYGKTIYEKAKEEKLSQWVIQKYLSDPKLFINKNLDEISGSDIKKEISKRQKEVQGEISREWNEEKQENEYISEGIKKGGVHPKNVSSVYGRIEKNFMTEKFEGDSNFEKFKGTHSDLVLEKGSENKFIIMEVRNPSMNVDFLKDILYNFYPKFERLDLSYKWVRDKLLNNKLSDNDISKVFKNKPIASVVIARPSAVSYGLYQHSYIVDDFKNARDLIEINSNDLDSVDKEKKVLGKEKYDEIDNFIEKIVSKIKEESNYDEIINKIKEISIPTDIQPTILVTGGGFMELKNDGTVIISGKSGTYGGTDNEKVAETLKDDFPDKNFIVN